MAYVSSKRAAALGAVDAQRQALMVDITHERVASLDAVDVLRKQTVLDADAISSRIIRRGALTMAGLLVMAALLTVGVLRWGPRPRPPG